MIRDLLDRHRGGGKAISAVLRALRTLLFGYDVFVSYAHGDRSTPYARKLELALRERDFAVFRDETVLEAGCALTPTIRAALKRSRTLVVLLSSGVDKSEWVSKELDLFGTRRPVCAVDIEGLWVRGDLGEFGAAFADRLVVTDDLTGPTGAALDRLAKSSAGRRVNRRARTTLAGVSMVVCAASIAAAWLGVSLQERSRDLIATAQFRVAETHHDPVAQALILSEIDFDRLPVVSGNLVRAVAKREAPVTVLRRIPLDFESMHFSADGRSILTLAYKWEGEDRSVVIDRIDLSGAVEPVRLGELPGWTLLSEGVLEDGSGVFIEDDHRLAVIHEQGLICTVDAVTQARINRSGAVAPGAPPVVGEPWFARWRLDPSGRHAMAPVESGIVVVHCETGDIVYADGLGGVGVTASRLHEVSHAGVRATVLTDDGRVLKVDTSRTAEPVRVVATFDFSDQSVSHTFVGPNGAVSVAHTTYDDDFKAVGSTLEFINPEGQISRWAATQGGLSRWYFSRSGTKVLLMFENGLFGVFDLVSQTYYAQPGATNVRLVTPAEALSEDFSLEQAADVFTDNEAAINGDGETVALQSLRSVFLWDVMRGGLPRQLTANNLVDGSCPPAFSRDGAWIATSEQGAIRVWAVDVPEVEPTQVRLPGRGGRVALRDGTIIAVCDNGTAARVNLETRSAETIEILQNLVDDTPPLVSSDARHVVYKTDDGRLIVADLGGTIVAEHAVDNELVPYQDVRVGERELCYTEPGTPGVVHRWDFETGEIVQHSHPQPLKAWDLVPSTGELFTLDETHTLRRFSRIATDELGTYSELEPDTTVWGIDVSADGSKLLVGAGRCLLGWCAETGVWSWTLPYDDDEIWTPLIMGDRFVAGTESGRLGVGNFARKTIDHWMVSPELAQPAENAAGGQIAHVGMIFAIVSDPNSGLFATAGALDATVRVWDIDEGYVSRIPIQDIPREFVFLDTDRLAMTSEQGVLSVWTARPEALLKKLATRTSAVLLPAERMRYLVEPERTAWRRYVRSERRRGHEPLEGEYLVEVDIQF